MVAIIDYDAGNILSVQKALTYLGENPVLTRDADTLLSADKVILPGVGAFRDAMNQLKKYELVSVCKEIANRNIPFLGVCLGEQLLFDYSEEGGITEGLGLIKGRVLRIPDGEYSKIPHMGWNSLELKGSGRLFKEIENGAYVYFVHSFYVSAESDEVVKATTEYNATIHASVEQGNVFGCQFHPEKSGTVGLQILRNFLEL